MNDKDPKYDLNDELLSAYLDGELSVDQRAVVEARLATDPAAQHLLHQLRSVSESVQALPQEKLGRDLSQLITGRVRESRVVRGSPDPAQVPDRRSPSAADQAAPNVQLFHSKRAWIWASLALAAGLMIMIVQSGDESANKLPPVAQRSEPNVADQAADETPERARREIMISPAPSSPPPAAVAAESQAREKADMPAAAAAKPVEPPRAMSESATGGKLAGPGLATASPSFKKDRVDIRAQHESDIVRSPETPLMDSIAKSPQPGGPASGASAPFGAVAGGGAGGDTANFAAGDRRFVVVHVVATPDAIKNKSFDRLLESKQIKLESQPAKSTPLSVAAGDRYAGQPQSETAIQQQENQPAEPPAEDLVLVESSPAAIESFLSALNKDTNDYVRIDVDNGSSAHAGTALDTTTADKKLVDNFSAYSRGAVPAKPKDSRSDYAYYYDKLEQHAINGSPRGGRYGVETRAPAQMAGKELPQRMDQKAHATQTLGRALRVDWSESKTRQLNETRDRGRAFHSDDAAMKQVPELEQKIGESAKPAASNDTLKVLFVLTPKDALAPSAPPADQPK